jgi:competence protein ComEC
MRRPFVILGAAFCPGILFAIWTNIALPVFYALAIFFLFLSLFFIKRQRRFLTFVLLSFFMLGAALLRNSQILPSGHISKQMAFFRPDITIKGSIISDPLVSGNKTSFIFSAREIISEGRGYKASGKILVKTYRPGNFSYGREMILSGRIFRPYNFMLSSGLNYREYLRRKGVYLILSVGRKGKIKDLQSDKGNPVVHFALWLKGKMEETIERNLEPVPASILNAMLLGERKAVPGFVNDAMVKTGTVHILVVSGFNVGIVAFIFLNLLKALRVSRRARLWLTIFILVIYCFLTGASTPVVRATIMGLILLLGYLLEREPDIYNSLSLAAIVILAISPWQILDVGFQLSFGSVLAIVWLYPKIKAWFSPRLLRKGYIRGIIQAFAVSLSAWIGTVGLIAYYFRIISPVTVLANMIIVPLTSYITACGFALVTIGRLFPAWGYLFAKSCELAIWGLLKVSLILSEAKGAYFRINPLPLGYILGYYLIIIGIGSLKSILRLLTGGASSE